MKRIAFHPKALKAIRKFPESVKKELGKAIYDLEKGESLSMPLSKPIKQVGQKVEEIRIRDIEGNENNYIKK